MGAHYDRLKKDIDMGSSLRGEMKSASIGLGLACLADALETAIAGNQRQEMFDMVNQAVQHLAKKIEELGEAEDNPVPCYMLCPHCGRGYREPEDGDEKTGEPFRCRCENWIKWTSGKLEDAS